jgi:multiple sugar transport system ATP-binding protein
MATLTLDKLNLKYPDGTHAVRDVDMTVHEGEFCVFLGPSGCGKTSTLRMIAGLETPTSGEIRLADRVINNLYPGERDIAMVFQHYALYPNKTVRQHFEMPLKAHRVGKDERNRRVAETAALLHMTDLLDAKPRQLSGGQAQRTAIGRALIRQPKLFLLDEPLTNLDANLRRETRAALKRLQEDLEITTIYVTHDQEEALSLADRIVVMQDGRVQQVADSQQLYMEPNNLFVAGFVGTPPMNFISASLSRNGGAPMLTTNPFDIPVPPGAAEAVTHLPDGAALIAGVRPEDLALSERGPQRSLGGSVLVTELHGDEFIVSIETEPAHLWKVRAPRIDGPAARAGDHVGLRMRPNALRLFDAATGVRLL